MSHLQTDSRTNFLHILLKYFETKFSVFKARLRLQHEKICIVDNILWSIKRQHTIVALRFKLLWLITSLARWGNFYRIHLHPCITFHYTYNMPFKYKIALPTIYGKYVWKSLSTLYFNRCIRNLKYGAGNLMAKLFSSKVLYSNICVEA